MAILLNRKYSSRIECLYYVLKSAFNNFANERFIISDIRYDAEAKDNVLNHCSLLKTGQGINIRYCPFLNNPLNRSKCYVTQSVECDSTKSKAASSVVRAWEALGFVQANEEGFSFTDKGKQFGSSDFDDPDWFNIMRDGVLSYGPVIGYLKNAIDAGETFDSSKIYASYPSSNDPINLSTSSTSDSNTRTVSLLTSWCLQAGLIEPSASPNKDGISPHIFYRNIINAARLTIRNFRVTTFAHEYLSSSPYVINPLSYPNLNKNVGSLRERNSQHIRNITQRYNPIILNRRFAIIFIINNSDKEINFNTLVALFKSHYDSFFLPNSNVRIILQSELAICTLVGLLLNVETVNNDIIIKKYTSINNDILATDAPKDLIETTESMIKKL